MPSVRFTRNIQRHVECPTLEVPGATLREVLDSYFRQNAPARGYVLDDLGQPKYPEKPEGYQPKTPVEGTPVEWSLKLVWALEPGGADEAGESLAMGSTTGSVWISDDAGDSWQTVSANLPPVYAVRFEKTM